MRLAGIGGAERRAAEHVDRGERRAVQRFVVEIRRHVGLLETAAYQDTDGRASAVQRLVGREVIRLLQVGEPVGPDDAVAVIGPHRATARNRLRMPAHAYHRIERRDDGAVGPHLRRQYRRSHSGDPRDRNAVFLRKHGIVQFDAEQALHGGIIALNGQAVRETVYHMQSGRQPPFDTRHRVLVRAESGIELRRRDETPILCIARPLLRGKQPIQRVAMGERQVDVEGDRARCINTALEHAGNCGCCRQ